MNDIPAKICSPNECVAGRLEIAIVWLQNSLGTAVNIDDTKTLEQRIRTTLDGIFWNSSLLAEGGQWIDQIRLREGKLTVCVAANAPMTYEDPASRHGFRNGACSFLNTGAST